MPTDCSVLRTPTILPNIRISWDYHPALYAHIGAGSKVFHPPEQAHVGLATLTLASLCCRYKNSADSEVEKMEKQIKRFMKAEKGTHQDDTECAVDLCSDDLCGEYF